MTDDIPECIKRDKDNRAPFMLTKCTDDPRGGIDFGLMKLTPVTSPPASPPAQWLPPWEPKT